jgi:hypothetical protein
MNSPTGLLRPGRTASLSALAATVGRDYTLQHARATIDGLPFAGRENGVWKLTAGSEVTLLLFAPRTCPGSTEYRDTHRGMVVADPDHGDTASLRDTSGLCTPADL